MLISNEIDTTLRLQMLECLLTALDHCSDMVQITDHEDKLIFQNSSGERTLGYSSNDLLSPEKHLWDFQSTSAMYSHVVLEENEGTVSEKVNCTDNNGWSNLKKYDRKMLKIDNIHNDWHQPF